MTNINKFSKERQQIARENLLKMSLDFAKNKDNILLEYCTGSGKTFNSLCILREKYEGGRILVTVEETTSIDNFKEDVIKLGFSEYLEHMDIICYASLRKYVDKKYTFWIGDEIHNCLSEARIKYSSRIKAKYSVVLSATIDDEAYEKLMTIRKFCVISYPYQKAVKDGLLPPVRIVVRTIELDDKWAKYPCKFGKVTNNLTQLGKYKYLSKKVDYYKDKMSEAEGTLKKVLFNLMLRAGKDRQQFLGLCKTNKIKDILSKIPEDRALVFCTTVEQAHEIGGKNAVSSHNSKKVNKEIIKNFNLGNNQTIFAVGMLIEAMNLNDTKYCIVSSLGNKELKATQQIGRSLRHEDPVVCIIVVKNTVDEKYLQKSFKMNILGEVIKN